MWQLFNCTQIGKNDSSRKGKLVSELGVSTWNKISKSENPEREV